MKEIYATLPKKQQKQSQKRRIIWNGNIFVFKAAVSRILPNWVKLRMNIQNVKRIWQQANTKEGTDGLENW